MRIFGYTITRHDVAMLEGEMDALRSICKSNYDHEYEISDELERVREERDLYKRLYGEEKENTRDAERRLNEASLENEALRSSTKGDEPKSDQVDHPDHYASNGKMECIEAMAIESAMLEKAGVTPLQSFCYLNAFKYIWRKDDKGSEQQDIRKAMWYIDKFNTQSSEKVTYSRIWYKVKKYKSGCE